MSVVEGNDSCNPVNLLNRFGIIACSCLSDGIKTGIEFVARVISF